jgi:hypothetical protein
VSFVITLLPSVGRAQSFTTQSLRDGDLVQRGLINLNCTVRSEHIPGRVDLDDKGRPSLVVLPNGKPLTRNGRYVPRKGDDWLVFSSLRSEYHVLLPDLPKR